MSSGSWPSQACTDQPGRGEARLLVGDVGQRSTLPSIEMPLSSQITISSVELLHAGEPDRLVADALHQAAVAGDHPGVVVDDLAPKRAARLSSAIAMPTAVARPWPSGPVVVSMPDAVAVFGMALGLASRAGGSACISSMRHAGVAGQVQQPVEQHRAVAGREHEAVAVRPVRGAGVELQVPLEQHGRDVGHAHRHARDARTSPPATASIASTRSAAARRPVIGVTLAEFGDVHGAGLPASRRRLRAAGAKTGAPIPARPYGSRRFRRRRRRAARAGVRDRASASARRGSRPIAMSRTPA